MLYGNGGIGNVNGFERAWNAGDAMVEMAPTNTQWMEQAVALQMMRRWFLRAFHMTMQRAVAQMRSAWFTSRIQNVQQYVTGQLGMLADDIDRKQQLMSKEACIRLMKRTAVTSPIMCVCTE